MADLTKTITDTIQVLGGQPTSRWGVMVWGVDEWGAGQPEVQEIGKFIANSQTLDDLSYYHPTKSYGLSIALADDITQIVLRDAAGYYHVFQGNTTDADDMGSTTWSAAATPTTSWSSVSTVSTDWSIE